jgi:hypothetical protein
VIVDAAAAVSNWPLAVSRKIVPKPVSVYSALRPSSSAIASMTSMS